MVAHIWIWALTFTTLGLLNTGHGFAFDTKQQALAIYYQQSYIANPLLGVGTAPEPVKYLSAYSSTIDFAAEVQLIIEELVINEKTNSFDARYTWHLKYNDSRFFDTYWESNASTNACQSVCSTAQGLVLNSAGNSACCDGSYLPNAHFLDLRYTNLPAFPQEWYWYGRPDSDEVNYFFRSRSTFNADFNFIAFPFDWQKLHITVKSDFIPSVQDNSLVLSPQPLGLPEISRTHDFPGTNPVNFRLNGWDVKSMTVNVVGMKQTFGTPSQLKGQNLKPNMSTAQGTLTPGIQFTITVSRRTTAFYIQIFLLPPALEVLLVFGSYCFDMQHIKGRTDLLAAAFLAILFIQYSVRSYLPAETLLPPYIVCLLCYAYMFLFAATYVFLEYMRMAYKHTERQRRLLKGRLRFSYFERQQLKKLIRADGEVKHFPEACRVEADRHEIRKALASNQRAIDALNIEWKALAGPWYMQNRSKLQLALVRKFPIARRLSQWLYCIQSKQAEKYCHEVAEMLERVIGMVLFVTYYIALLLIYVLQPKLSTTVGPL